MGATLIAILLAGTAHEADCLRWAAMVERMAEVPAQEWPAKRQEWTAGARDKLVRQYVQRAINHIEAGLPPAEAWRECGSV